MKNTIKRLSVAVSLFALVALAFGEDTTTTPTTPTVSKPTTSNVTSKVKALPRKSLNFMRRSLLSAAPMALTQTYTGDSYNYWCENNKMVLNTGVWYTSGGWRFFYNNTWATTSYRENYAVWFDNQIYYGYWGEWGDHQVIKLFGGNKNDPDNSCIIRMANKIDVERKITISPADGTYFKICYKLTNITDQPIENIRFFELVDFDIPWTGDHGNDIGWYDPLTDFVWVKDESWFQNGFTGNRPSDRHSVNEYYYVIEGDANDGELDNNNESAYNDPGIGMQWNAGTLQPGQSWSMDVTFWFGQPTGLFAVAGQDRTVHEGQQIQFDASESRATETTIVSYEWDMDGDGEFDDATGVSPTWTYDKVGVYSVVLRVTDNEGTQAYDECSITVLPAMFKDVTVRSFLPGDGLLLDPASIIKAPFTVTQENGENVIKWNVGSMNIGDKKTLSFDVEVLNPILGERRMLERENITNYLDNMENAKNTDGTFHEPKPIELMLGPSYVDVISAFGINVSADKDEYLAPETATFTSKASLPLYTAEKMASTQDEFNNCGLTNVDTTSVPGAVVLVKNTENQYNTEGQVSFIVQAPSSAKWGKVYFDATKYSNNDIAVKTRSAASLSALQQAVFSEEVFTSGADITSEKSLYLEVLLSLKAVDQAKTPELKDIRVTYSTEDFQVKVSVLDEKGTVINTPKTYPVSDGDYGKELTYTDTWNTGTTLPGNYTVKADIVNFRTGEIVETARDTFKISEQKASAIVNSSISTNKVEYAAVEDIFITSRVFNTSTNEPVNGLTVDVVVSAPDGTTAIANFNYAIASILQSANHEKSLQTSATTDLATGNYTVTQTVKMNGVDVSTASTTFRIVDAAVQGKGISGTLTAQPMTVKRRIGDLAVSATAVNTGNVDLAGVTFRVRIFDVAGQNVLKEFTEVSDLPKAGSGYAKTHAYGSKVELMPGTYPMVLTAEFTYNGEALTIPLDARGFIVTNTAPVANAGSDIVTTTTVRVGIPISLNGSGSTDENSTDAAKKNDIVSYEWKKGDTVLGTGETLTTNLAAGIHDITLTVTDTCGAKHSDNVKVTITQIVLPPTISDLSPVHETITKELALGAKATDPIWGIDWTSLVFKAGTTVLTASYDGMTGAITSAFPADAADGWYDLNITIKNQGGADATTPAWRVGLDRTAPVITEMAPSADVYANNAQPTISAKVTDAFSGVKPETIRVKIGETVLEHTYNAETGVVTATVPTALADGWHNAVIEVADNVGNANSATWRVGVDITPPEITNMLPTANTEINESAQEISAVVADAMSGIKADTIVLKLNDTVVEHTYNTETGKVSFNASNLANGAQTVFISVSDNAGNVSSTTWVFNVMLRVPGSEYLLFHNSSTGELTITGGNKTVNGIAHSNAAIKIRGNNTTITGQTTAIGTISVNGKDHNVALQQSNAPAVAMPVYPYDYYVANATQVHNGDLTIASGATLQPGIHLVNGNVTIRATQLTGVTIVATGNIKLSSKDTTITHGDTKYKVALYSRDGNIDSSVNGLTVTGVVYAPAGQIKVQSNDSNFTGAIVADKVEFNGQNMTLNPLEY